MVWLLQYLKKNFFLFWNNLRFAKELQRQYKEFQYMLHLTSPNDSVLHNRSTFIKTEKLMLVRWCVPLTINKNDYGLFFVFIVECTTDTKVCMCSLKNNDKCFVFYGTSVHVFLLIFYCYLLVSLIHRCFYIFWMLLWLVMCVVNTLLQIVTGLFILYFF